MINAITGVPGEGKTCFSVQHIILKELMVGSRPIYSNVAWHKDEVIKFCQSYGYEVDPNRLNTLPDEHIQHFWKYTCKDSLIVLDEVAEFFNAQAWKDFGPEIGSYARQHRKLGHETYLIVQDIGHIYKQFRDMIFEEIRIVNLSNRSLGPFKFPKFFLAKWILKDTRTVQQTKLYKFNTEVFATYSTLATSGTLLETAEPPNVKETTQKLNSKNIKQKFFNILGKHWLLIAVVSFFIGILTIPRYFFDFSTTSEIKNNENTNQETNSNINDDADAEPVSNRPNKRTRDGDRERHTSGRYDSSSKRPLRQQDSPRQ